MIVLLYTSIVSDKIATWMPDSCIEFWYIQLSRCSRPYYAHADIENTPTTSLPQSCIRYHPGLLARSWRKSCGRSVMSPAPTTPPTSLNQIRTHSEISCYCAAWVHLVHGWGRFVSTSRCQSPSNRRPHSILQTVFSTCVCLWQLYSTEGVVGSA